MLVGRHGTGGETSNSSSTANQLVDALQLQGPLVGRACETDARRVALAEKCGARLQGAGYVQHCSLADRSSSGSGSDGRRQRWRQRQAENPADNDRLLRIICVCGFSLHRYCRW